MPGWQPLWGDVGFDHAAAASSAAAADATAATLEQVAWEEAGAATRSLHGWTGGAQQDFLADRAALARAGAELTSRLRRLADEIRGAAVAARHEQARRVEDRARWRSQRRAELAARHA